MWHGEIKARTDVQTDEHNRISAMQVQEHNNLLLSMKQSS